jgi:excisionase family DNA binding protein
MRTFPKTRRFKVAVEDRWLGVEELARYLGVSKDTIYVWLTRSAVPGHRIGKLWKFKREEIDEWVKAGHAASAALSRQANLKPKRGSQPTSHASKKR